MSKCQIFCLPYAGGSSLIYSDWRTLLSSHIEIVPIEMNGRGKRLVEPFYKDTQEAAEDILKQIIPLPSRRQALLFIWSKFRRIDHL